MPTMSDAFDPTTYEDALRVARMYHYEELTTEQIAAQLGVSRPKVSRLLSWAKQNGLIEVRVLDPRRHQLALERAIEDRYAIRDVKVVPIPLQADDDERLQTVTRFTAYHLNTILRPRMTVALAWGNTVSQLARALVPKPLPGSQVVQMNGSGNSGTGITYAADIIMRFAENYAGTPSLMPIPAYFDDPSTKQAMFRERSIERVHGVARRADAVLFSIGVPDADSYIYRAGYIERDDLDALLADGVVGDIATMFFRADGSWRDIDMNARSSGLSLDTLAAHPHTICIVDGARKREAILGALRGGFMNTLIIDEPTAHTLV
jgi:DNA-binding transcriptional regulator LsrR (DeoR family)